MEEKQQVITKSSSRYKEKYAHLLGEYFEN